MSDKPFAPHRTAARLRAILRLLGISKTKFGKIMNYTPQQVNGVLKGDHVPTHAPVFAIIEATDIGADWILYGYARGLSYLSTEDRVNLLQYEREALSAIEAELAASSGKPQDQG